MEQKSVKPTLDKTISFRAESAMVEEIGGYQKVRGLRDFSDAARELMETAVQLSPEIAELRTLGGNPAEILRAAIPALSTRNPTG